MNELGNGENDVEEDLDEDIETDEDAVADIGDGDGASDMTGEVNVEALMSSSSARYTSV